MKLFSEKIAHTQKKKKKKFFPQKINFFFLKQKIDIYLSKKNSNEKNLIKRRIFFF